MLLHWHEDRAVGHAGIDDAHRRVVTLFNDLDTALTLGAPQAVLHSTLDRLDRAIGDYFHDVDRVQGEPVAALRCEWGRKVQALRATRMGGSNDHRALVALARWWQDNVAPAKETSSGS